MNGFHGFPLPTIHSIFPLHTKGSPLIGKRFIINSPIHLNYSGLFPLGGLNIDMSKLFNVSTQLVLDSIRPTLPASKEISHTCRIGLKTTSQNEIDFVKAMMKIYKVCAVCDKFDTNTTTCETVGFCPKNSVCYQGYTDDRKYWPKSNVYNIFDAMHPRAGFHGCCLPTDSRCRYHRYIVKNKNNHNLKSANYTIHTCSSSLACNGNDRHAVSSFVSKLTKVDGHWAQWGHWSHCSHTCGLSSKTRTRTCSNPKPSGGGKNCIGSSTSMIHCTYKACPVDGHWTSWGQWGQCSVTCGGGTKLRHRTCTHPAPSDGGKTCSGSSSLARSCSTTSCPVDGHWHHWQAWGSCSVTCGHGTKTRVRTCTSVLFGGKPCTGSSHNSTTCGSPCPIDGHWGGWGAWGTCSVTCGNGKESRARTCSNPQPANGGKQCVGETSDARSCGQPCRIDGHWSQWGRWGHCSVTCGTGTKTRSRTCSHPKPSGGGKSCSGSATSTTPCTSTACPVDGHWASWGHWGHCSVTCGDGTKGRNRTCTNPSPSGGGKTCAGSSASTTACSSKACPVDGRWATWGHWGHCSVTCGDGTKARNRTCTSPSPSGGGKTCAGSSASTTACSPKACPVDGHWNHWQAWGSCSVTCGAGTKTRVRSCSRVLYGGKPCSGSSSKSASCGSPCPIDGQWGAWEAWGKCSVTCGNGKETRARTCSDPQPAHGGKQCVGESSESRHCGQPCKVDGQWGAWQAWGTCSVTCGDGKEKRTRTCSNPQPAYGGTQCAGDATQARHCGQPCKIDGNWSTWNAWGTCSVTCGDGKETRSRTCSNPQPAYGGKTCTGDASQDRHCGKPCIIDGQWTTWQEWTKCSKSCASGTRSRDRTCTNPAPANGGTDCTGDKSVTESCNTDSCPQWSRWFHDACSVSCGNGTTMRLRHCSSGKDADCGGGKAFENVACNEKPCPVDGSWGTWNTWSKCTATCGEGQHSRTRLCDHPSPQNGGADCSGPSDETAVCNTHECPHWLPFQELSSCSVTCGKGFIQLKRTCSTGIESDCTGSAYNEKTCILDECI